VQPLNFWISRTRSRRGASKSCVLRLAFAVSFSVGLVAAARQARAEDAVAGAVYVRTDSDDTVVVSPHARARKQLLETTAVEVTYAADIWTSASVDIRASASKPVTEQRDELQGTVSHELTDLTLSGTYRYSVENDYTSHGAFASAAYDFADNDATLALNAFGLFDTVGRAGFPAFSKRLDTFGARLSFTQVLDTKMLAQITYELAHMDGYMASPYRKVGPGGTGFGCVGAPTCLDEHEPGARTRHAAALVVRRALSEAFSLGASYRFILDDWGIKSHTATVELGLTLATDSLLGLRYRFYTQTGVRFYQRVYALPLAPGAYTTRDREQSPMHDQRLSLDWEQKAHVARDLDLAITTSVAGTLFEYDNFVGLALARALELTLAVALVR
jgi:hypothetical protein